MCSHRRFPRTGKVQGRYREGTGKVQGRHRRFPRPRRRDRAPQWRRAAGPRSSRSAGRRSRRRPHRRPRRSGTAAPPATRRARAAASSRQRCAPACSGVACSGVLRVECCVLPQGVLRVECCLHGDGGCASHLLLAQEIDSTAASRGLRSVSADGGRPQLPLAQALELVTFGIAQEARVVEGARPAAQLDCVRPRRRWSHSLRLPISLNRDPRRAAAAQDEKCQETPALHGELLVRHSCQMQMDGVNSMNVTLELYWVCV